MAVSHVFSNAVADFTGTITGFNSQGSTTTIAATNLVRPSDWNSGHNQFYTLSGNTNNASTASGTNVVFQGVGGVTLVGSTGTIGISGAAPATFSGYNPYPDRPHIVQAVGQATIQFDPEHLPDIVFDRAYFGLHNTNSSNSSGSHSLGFTVGLYTKNASTLSLWGSASGSTAITHSGTAGSYSLFSGIRLFTVPWTTTVTEGKYWLAFGSTTTSGGANGSYSNVVVSGIASGFSGHFGSSHATTAQWTLGQGIFTANTSAMPGSVAFSHIRGSDSQAMRAPVVMFASGTI
jgi:hypothetical protein